MCVMTERVRLIERPERVRLIRPRPRSIITIADALMDDQLIGAALGDPDSWHVWMSVLRAAFGLELDADELKLFQTVAGIPYNYSRDGQRFSFGRSDYETVSVQIPAAMEGRIGKVDFWTELEKRH